MEPTAGDRAFGSTIAEVYHRHLVPLIFEPYAVLVAERVAALQPTRVLEIAAGTGVLTRALGDRLDDQSSIVASDLNRAMLDRAIAVGTARTVEWCQADALSLPFDTATADVVLCQFGAMFFPSKPRAFAEARRVLAPSGTLLLTVWDQLETNEFAAIVDAEVVAQFPHDPPSFLRRTPHGYFDPAAIAADLRDAGFESAPTFVTLAARSVAASARLVAEAYCEGTPLRTEIEARAGSESSATTRRVEDALARRFGSGTVDGMTQAVLVIASR